MKKEFVEKFLKLQLEIKAPKNSFNSFGKYKYRNVESILEGYKSVAMSNGLILTISDSVELIGDRYYIKATATITDGESSIEAVGYAREAITKKGMDDSQVTGATSSYARKYALGGLFCLDDNEDADYLGGFEPDTDKDNTIQPNIPANVAENIDRLNKSKDKGKSEAEIEKAMMLYASKGFEAESLKKFLNSLQYLGFVITDFKSIKNSLAHHYRNEFNAEQIESMFKLIHKKDADGRFFFWDDEKNEFDWKSVCDLIESKTAEEIDKYFKG